MCGVIRVQYANEPVAASEFRTDEIALRAERVAQRRDLNFEVPFRHNDAGPHPSDKLFLCDERAIRLKQDQKDVEGARAEFDWNTVGEQPPPAQQHAEPSEFEGRVGSYRPQAGCAVK
jgi:hypothetical protein